MKPILLGFAAAMALATPVQAFADAPVDHSKMHGGAIHLQDGWARFSPVPGRPAGAYLTIHGGAADDRLVGASSPVAGRVELHTHQMAGGIMKMVKVGDIAIPRGGEVALKPGGLHLMLFDVKQRPKDGATFPITLTFAKAGKQTIQVKAQALGTAQLPKKEAVSHEQHQH